MREWLDILDVAMGWKWLISASNINLHVSSMLLPKDLFDLILFFWIYFRFIQ
jgi:hypothetical protein